MHEANFPATVFAIVPARDEEANIAEAVTSLDLQPELAGIIVVDDQSSDSTPEILAALAAHVSRLKILETQSLPEGWTGKNYAAALGAEFVLNAVVLKPGAPEAAAGRVAPTATGAGSTIACDNRWLLFSDADTRHLPSSLGAALRIAAEKDAALVSFSPRQQMETFWERALIPIVYCRLACRYPFDRVNDPRCPDAAANGQYLLIRADAYEAIGGHAAIRACVLEDVELARRAKSAGYRIWFQSGESLVETRMYHSLRAMWEGWTKNLYLLFGGRGRAMLVELLPSVTMLLASALLVLGLFMSFAIAPGALPLAAPLAALGALALLVVHVRQRIASRQNHYTVRFIQYYVPGVLLFGAALTASWWRNTFGTVRWKGRRYPAGMR